MYIIRKLIKTPTEGAARIETHVTMTVVGRSVGGKVLITGPGSPEADPLPVTADAGDSEAGDADAEVTKTGEEDTTTEVHIITTKTAMTGFRL